MATVYFLGTLSVSDISFTDKIKSGSVFWSTEQVEVLRCCMGVGTATYQVDRPQCTDTT